MTSNHNGLDNHNPNHNPTPNPTPNPTCRAPPLGKSNGFGLTPQVTSSFIVPLTLPLSPPSSLPLPPSTHLPPPSLSLSSFSFFQNEATNNHHSRPHKTIKVSNKFPLKDSQLEIQLERQDEEQQKRQLQLERQDEEQRQTESMESNNDKVMSNKAAMVHKESFQFFQGDVVLCQLDHSLWWPGIISMDKEYFKQPLLTKTSSKMCENVQTTHACISFSNPSMKPLVQLISGSGSSSTKHPMTNIDGDTNLKKSSTKDYFKCLSISSDKFLKPMLMTDRAPRASTIELKEAYIEARHYLLTLASSSSSSTTTTPSSPPPSSLTTDNTSPTFRKETRQTLVTCALDTLAHVASTSSTHLHQ